MSTKRDELARALAAAYGESPSRADEDAADSILAAGYRKQQQVTTVEELDALPVETVVRSATGFVWEKDVDDEEPDLAWWSTPSDSRQYPARRIGLPATVLHVGGAE